MAHGYCIPDQQLHTHKYSALDSGPKEKKKKRKTPSYIKYSGNHNGYKLSQSRKKKGLKVHSVFLFKRKSDIENIYGQEKMAKALKKKLSKSQHKSYQNSGNFELQTFVQTLKQYL